MRRAGCKTRRGTCGRRTAAARVSRSRNRAPVSLPPPCFTELSTGNYVVKSSTWHNGAATSVGAVTLGEGILGTTGPISAANSVIGAAAGGGGSMNFVFDGVNRQLVVGRPADNIVTLFRTGNNGIAPAVEDAAPNGGDGNADGILDSLQPNVASLPASGGQGYLTLVATGSAGAPDGCSMLRNVYTLTGPADPGFRYPFGMIGFELDNCPPPFSATLTLILHGGGGMALSGISYRKFSLMAPTFTGPQSYPLLSGAPNNLTLGTTPDSRRRDGAGGDVYASGQSARRWLGRGGHHHRPRRPGGGGTGAGSGGLSPGTARPRGAAQRRGGADPAAHHASVAVHLLR